MKVKDISLLPFINDIIQFPSKPIFSQIRVIYNEIKIWIITWVRKTPYLGALLNRQEIRAKIISALAKDTVDFEQYKMRTAREALELQNSEKFSNTVTVILPNSQYQSMLDRFRAIQLQFDLRTPIPAILSASIPSSIPSLVPATTSTSTPTSSSTTVAHASSPISVELEKDIIKRCGRIFSGPEDVGGFVAFNNWDAIVACLRSYAEKAKKRGISAPEMIVFTTAQDDYLKAAAELTSLNIKLITLPVHPKTQLPDLEAVNRAINANTMLILASTPSSTTGVIDPILELSNIAQHHQVGLHVDGVSGGMLLPWAKKCNAEIPAMDFTLAGVTSIAIHAAHKNKISDGPVVIMFRDCVLTQSHTETNQTYILKTAVELQRESSLAEAWATLLYLENDNSKTTAQVMINLRDKLLSEINKLSGIGVVANPQLGIIALQSDRYNMVRAANRMKKIGWGLEGISINPNPKGKGLILSLSAENADRIDPDKFMRDLNATLTFVEANPEPFMGSVVLFSMKPLQKPSLMLELADAAVQNKLAASHVSPKLEPSNSLDTDNSAKFSDPTTTETAGFDLDMDTGSSGRHSTPAAAA